MSTPTNLNTKKPELPALNNSVVTFISANHTPSGSKVVRLNQTYKTGPSKSLKVYPGDKVDMETWAYYEGSTGWGSTSTGVSAFITNVAAAFGGVSGGGGESSSIYNGVNTAYGAAGMAGNQGDTRPSAYLNYILFDKDYKFLDMGWEPVPSTANMTKQQMSIPTVNIKEAGYIFVYLSYEAESNNWVYFDDFKVSHTKTNIIQYNEYYPFGLASSTSWTRENNKNDFLYNAGSELNQASGWYDLPFRNYDAALGRFMQVDPMATSEMATYQYAGNNPVYFNDPSGALKYDNSHAGFMQKLGESAGNQAYVAWASDFGGSMGGGSSGSASANSFIGAALRSQHGGTWSNGNSYLFESDEEAFQAGAAYNFQHNSWGNTYYGSYEASYVSFLVTRFSGEVLEPEIIQAAIAQVNYYHSSSNAISCNEPNCTHGITNGGGPSSTDLYLAGIGGAGLVAESQSSIINSSRSGFTSGKLSVNSPRIYSKATAVKVNLAAKGVGWGLTFWSVYNTESQFRNGEIDASRRGYNHLNNGVGVIVPIMGLPLAAGDYLGQKYPNEIVNDISQPGGFAFEVMKSFFEFIGIPTSPPRK